MKNFNIKNHITTYYNLDFFEYNEYCYEENTTIQDEEIDLVTFVMDDDSEIAVSSIKKYSSIYVPSFIEHKTICNFQFLCNDVL